MTPVSRPFPCPLRLTLHVSNFDHRGGGFVRPLIAGPPEVIDRGRVSRAIHASALLSIYVLTGLLSLVIFAVRPRERVTLVFGVCCLAMAVYADMTAERLFLRLLATQLDWAAYMRVEYLAYVLAMGASEATRVPDAILCDYRLARHETGVEVIAQLRNEFNADIPALLVTGDTAPAQIQRVQASGLPVLHKPLQEHELRAALGALLAAARAGEA